MKHTTAVIVTLAASVAVSVLAASHRFGDSAHAMGMISERGGRAHHPVHLPSGGRRYVLIVTATILPPYSGDVTVAVEGDPPVRFDVHASEPVVDLGFRRRPRFRGGAFRGVRPGDRIAVWLRVSPGEVDPVCGHAVDPGLESVEHGRKTYRFCSAACRDAFLADPDRPALTAVLEGGYRVAFRDAASGRPVLEIPLLLGDGGGGRVHAH